MFRLLLIGLLISFEALAHGDATWIQQGNYRAASGEHCCGISDCGIIDPSDVETFPDGYKVRGYFVGSKDVLPSKDGNFWGCTKPGGIRCFFAPTLG